jgi:hypothetical protein
MIDLTNPLRPSEKRGVSLIFPREESGRVRDGTIPPDVYVGDGKPPIRRVGEFTILAGAMIVEQPPDLPGTE